jgi:CcmD family protein
MTYLFWALAVVWIGLCAYIYSLIRRCRMIEREIADLRGEARPATSGEVSGLERPRHVGVGE